MEYSGNSISPNELGTLALLGGLGRQPYVNNVGGREYGEESAIRADVVANRDAQQTSNINRANENQTLRSQIDVGNQFITDRINQQSINFQFAEQSRQSQDLQRQLFTQQLEQQRANADIARAVAENLCCCEKNAQKLDNLVELGGKDREIQTLQLQLAMLNDRGRRGNQGND